MQQRVATYVYADDPILQAGMVSQLRLRPEVDIVAAAELSRANVAVAVADSLDAETLTGPSGLEAVGHRVHDPGDQRHR